MTTTRRRRTIRAREGFTLIEMTIVIVIIGIVMGAVGIPILNSLEKAKKRTACSDGRTVANAATVWIAEHSGECPSVQALVDDGQLNRQTRTTDPWNHAFAITCEDNEVIVISSGKDGQQGNEDDISTLTCSTRN